MTHRHFANRVLRSRLRSQPSERRSAFTLIEMLIVLTVGLILLAITASALKVNFGTESVRGTARQIQSYVLGARDLAIYAKAPRGVRLLRDSTNPRHVSSIVLIAPTEPWSGQVQILCETASSPWNATSNPLTRVRLNDVDQVPDWIDLNGDGLLGKNARIRIPGNSRGTWYVVRDLDLSGANQDLLLTTAYRQVPPDTSSPVIYEKAIIELPASLVPNKQPIQFSKGVVIDLDRCGVNPSASQVIDQFGTKLPRQWKVDSGATFDYTGNMDILFSPQGTVTGGAAASGLIHLYVTEQTAADLKLEAYYDPVNSATWPSGFSAAPFDGVPEKIAVSVFARTGTVIASPISPTDPFVYAERGEVAAK
jgi:prepilin-type N-terminal cleavage/methylation domain-containing protein